MKTMMLKNIYDILVRTYVYENMALLICMDVHLHMPRVVALCHRVSTWLFSLCTKYYAFMLDYVNCTFPNSIKHACD